MSVFYLFIGKMITVYIDVFIQLLCWQKGDSISLPPKSLGSQSLSTFFWEYSKWFPYFLYIGVSHLYARFLESIIRPLILLMIQILWSGGQKKKKIIFYLFCSIVQAFFIHFSLSFLSFLKVWIMLMLFSISFYGRLFDFFPTFTERTNSLPF